MSENEKLLYYFSDETKATIDSLQTFLDALEESRSMATNLLTDIRKMAWSGEHVQHIMALLDIVTQYSYNLYLSGRDIKESIMRFERYFNLYKDMEEYKKIARIK